MDDLHLLNLHNKSLVLVSACQTFTAEEGRIPYALAMFPTDTGPAYALYAVTMQDPRSPPLCTNPKCTIAKRRVCSHTNAFAALLGLTPADLRMVLPTTNTLDNNISNSIDNGTFSWSLYVCNLLSVL